MNQPDLLEKEQMSVVMDIPGGTLGSGLTFCHLNSLYNNGTPIMLTRYTKTFYSLRSDTSRSRWGKTRSTS